jgi:oxygen-dependent protoporphyrinogen oxidase
MGAPPASLPRRARVVVVGGGVSGLALAHRLMDRVEVTLCEAGARPGGHATTVREEGFLVEAGPNGFLDRNPGPLALARELGLAGELIEARPEAKRRFVLRGGRLRRVPDSPPTLLTSDALSPAGKLRLLLEPWAGPRPVDREETVDEFARRRIGPEAADVLVGAAVAGISAGDSRLLSLPAAFPLMARMEREHGSLLRAFAARRRAGVGPPRLVAFRDGMGQLVAALAGALGPRLRTNAAVARVERGDGATPWRVVLADGTPLAADHVVLALPAPAAGRVVAGLDGELARTLAATPFSSVAVVALAFRAADLPRPLDGYGYLVGRHEHLSTLGVVFESVLFAGRAPQGSVLVRVILGGTGHPELAALPASGRIEIARRELAHVLGITAPPTHDWSFAWPGAIAQYVRGHRERVAAARAAAGRHEGLSLCGTSYDGIAFGAAVDAGRAHAEALLAGTSAP